MPGKIAYCLAVLAASIATAWAGQESAPLTGALFEQLSAGRMESVVIDSVLVRGGKPGDPSVPEGALLSRPGGVLNEGLVLHDIETLTVLFRDHGWWTASVTAAADSGASGSVVLSFHIERGPPVHIGTIATVVEGDIPPGLFFGDDDNNLRGQRFSRPLLDQTIGDIVTGLAANGFPAVTVHPLLSARADTVDVVLKVLPGEQARIDSIAVLGLSRTKDHIIRRELKSLIGRTADAEALRSADVRAQSIGVVHAVSPSRLEYTGEGRCILVTEFSEGRQGTFEGILGYQPSSGGESSEIVGKIDLAFPNLMGTARSSRIRWENLGKDTEDLELRYTEPWMFGLPYDLSGSFTQEEREKIGYTRTVIRSSVSRKTGSLRTDVGYRYEKVSADSVYSSSAHGLDADLTWSRIDNPLNPRSGVHYVVRWTTASKRMRFGKRDTHRLVRMEFDIDHYVPTAKKQTLALLLRYRRTDIPRENLSPSDRYLLGGSTSIRGYRERIFPAVNALWMTAEYRLLQGRASRVFAFVDSGSLVNYETVPGGGHKKKTINRTGFGFGLRIESRAGALGFDFGLGRGDGIGEGKLHVSLANSF